MNNNKLKLIIGVIVIAIVILVVVLLSKTETANGTMLDFVGSDYKQVEFFANQYNLELVVTRENSTKYDQDEVISQSISKGTVVEEGEKLEIVVSDGPSN
jgi:beta-lactam-binding protein with PASTA domain